MQDLTGTTVGRYSVRARLGAGGMGEVYRAEDTTLKRTVALKRIAPHLRSDDYYRQRFLKEAERASRLTDPHIAGVYDVLDQGGEMLLVMEYVEGETLRARLQKPLRVDDFLAFGTQCAEALDAAHRKGVVHRDIKPENIMLTPTGQVKILDFGVAKRLPRAGDTAATTESGPATTTGLSGTPGYMAPEVLLETEADDRADIFSLGVVFYEALSGQNPFWAGSFLLTSDRIRHEEPPPLSQRNPAVPPELDRIIRKMLAKDPGERYATAADLVIDLRALRRATTPPVPAAPRAGRPWRWVLNRLAAALVLLVILVGVIPSARRAASRWLGWNAIPERKNLAVLPFVNVGSDPTDKFFCDGLTSTLTSKLTQLEQFHGALLVVPMSDVVKVSSVEEARRLFGVNLALTGEVQRTGDQVRLSVNLVDAGSLRQLGSRTLDGEATDPRLLQDVVVRRVAELLEVELQPRLERVLAAGRTDVARAYDFYLQGRGYLENYDKPENIESAITLFNHALELDADYALAQAGLGEAYWRKYESSKDPQWVAPARQACQKALTLDAQLAGPHICLGTLDNGTGEYEKAVGEFSRALENDPTSDNAVRGLARAYERLGRMAEAEHTYRRAIEARPHYWAGYSQLGGFYFKQARYQEAAEMFEQVVALTPDNARGYSNLGGAYALSGRSDDAVAMYEKSISLRPNYRALSNLATVYFTRGRYAEAARTYERALGMDDRDYRVWGNLAASYQQIPGQEEKAKGAYEEAIVRAERLLEVNPRDPMLLGVLAGYHAEGGNSGTAKKLIQRALAAASPEPRTFFSAALVYERLGEREKALEQLARALERGFPMDDVRNAPSLAQLRQDPRFQALAHQNH